MGQLQFRIVPLLVVLLLVFALRPEPFSSRVGSRAAARVRLRGFRAVPAAPAKWKFRPPGTGLVQTRPRPRSAALRGASSRTNSAAGARAGRAAPSAASRCGQAAMDPAAPRRHQAPPGRIGRD